MKPWMWKTASIVFAVYIFGLVAVYIFVAGRSVDFSYTVAGQDEVVVGEPAALRVGVYDIFRGQFVPTSQVDVTLVRGDERAELYTGRTTATGFADVNLQVPAVEPGEASWHITFHPPELEPKSIEVPVRLIAPSAHDPKGPFAEAAMEVRPAEAASKPGVPPREGTGPVLLDLVAEGGAAADGLRSLYFVQATDRATGKPVAAEVKLELVKGMLDGEPPNRVKTHAGGLGYLAMVPIGSQKWKLTTETKAEDGQVLTSERELVVESRAKQFAMVLNRPIWTGDHNLELGVRTLHRSGVLWADVYSDGRWQSGEAAGIGTEGGGFSLRRPTSLESGDLRLMRVQVYGAALAPGEAADVRVVVAPPPTMEARAVLERLLRLAVDAGVRPKAAQGVLDAGWVATGSDKDVEAAISFWLSLLPVSVEQPALLFDSQKMDRGKLKDDKNDLKEPVSWLLGLSGALALLIVFYVVMVNVLKVRRESEAMVAELGDLEGDDADDEGTRKGLAASNLGRFDAVFQIIIVMGTLFLFFVAIVLLVRHI